MRINFLTDNAVKFWNLNDNQTQQHVLMIQDHPPPLSVIFMRFQESSSGEDSNLKHY